MSVAIVKVLHAAASKLLKSELGGNEAWSAPGPSGFVLVRKAARPDM